MRVVKDLSYVESLRVNYEALFVHESADRERPLSVTEHFIWGFPHCVIHVNLTFEIEETFRLIFSGVIFQLSHFVLVQDSLAWIES